MERYDISDHDCPCSKGVLCNGFHCTEPLCYRDSRGRLYHIFPLHRTPLLQRQSWSFISYLSIAQNPFATGTVVVTYIIYFHCTEPLFYRDSRGRLYHIFPLHRTPLLQGQSWSLISYLSIAQNPSSTGTVVVTYIISFHCTEPLFYRAEGFCAMERYDISDHDCPCSRGVLGNGKI
jgi:hypothetical protein